MDNAPTNPRLEFEQALAELAAATAAEQLAKVQSERARTSYYEAETARNKAQQRYNRAQRALLDSMTAG